MGGRAEPEVEGSRQELELEVAALGSSRGMGSQSRDLSVPGELGRPSGPQPSQYHPDGLQGVPTPPGGGGCRGKRVEGITPASSLGSECPCGMSCPEVPPSSSSVTP